MLTFKSWNIGLDSGLVSRDLQMTEILRASVSYSLLSFPLWIRSKSLESMVVRSVLNCCKQEKEQAPAFFKNALIQF